MDHGKEALKNHSQTHFPVDDLSLTRDYSSESYWYENLRGCWLEMDFLSNFSVTLCQTMQSHN